MSRAKRDWSEGRIVPRYELRLGEPGERAASSMKLSGSPSEVAGRIRELAGAGADGVVLSAGLDPEAAVETLRHFANEAPRASPPGRVEGHDGLCSARAVLPSPFRDPAPDARSKRSAKKSRKKR